MENALFITGNLKYYYSAILIPSSLVWGKERKQLGSLPGLFTYM